MAFGITPQGFILKQFTDIRDELLEVYRASQELGPGTSFDSNKVLSQIVIPIVEAVANVWELGQGTYNSFNPDNATGTSLDDNCAIIGIERKPATNTTVVDVRLFGTYGSLIDAGSIVSNDINGENFTLDTDITIGPSGYADGDFTASSTGPIECNSGTLTIIRSPTSGWDSVSNPEDGVLGSDIETDPALRLRRLQSLQLAGRSTIGGIFSNILQAVDNVSAVTVIENDGDVSDSDGRPPHSFEAIVLGGEDQDILDKILEVKAAGIQTAATGDNQVTGLATDIQGINHTINFSRPTEKDVYFHIEIGVDTANFNVGSKQDEKVTVENDTEVSYTSIVNGESRTFVNAASTKQEIAEGLTDAINNGLWLPVTAVYVPGNEYFNIISDYEGNVFTLSVSDPVDLTIDQITQNTGDQPTIEDAVLDQSEIIQGIGDNLILTKYYGPINSGSPYIFNITIRASETRWPISGPTGSEVNLIANASDLFVFDTARTTIEIV
jgi:uncharacterized phage protein gp47/JayE